METFSGTSIGTLAGMERGYEMISPLPPSGPTTEKETRAHIRREREWRT